MKNGMGFLLILFGVFAAWTAFAAVMAALAIWLVVTVLRWLGVL